MMARRVTQNLLFLGVISFSCWLSFVRGQCAKFQFPATNDSDIFTARENTTITMPFVLDTENCTTVDDFNIIVSRKDEHHIFRDFCKLLHENKTCTISFRSEKCACADDDKGHYSLIQTVSRSDDQTKWKWKTSEGAIASERELTFYILEPPRVSKLSFLEADSRAEVPHLQAIKPGTSVDVVCKYHAGRPVQTTAVLKDAGGNRLDVQQLQDVEPGQKAIQHRLRDVKCEDAGRFRCEAPQASRNLTATLLVQCPPQFVEKQEKHFVIPADQPYNPKWQIRSHTYNLTSCKLTKLPDPQHHRHEDTQPGSSKQSQEGFSGDCLSRVRMFGSRPSLTLELILKEAEGSQYVGKWQLNVTNEAGFDDVIFHIQVIGLDESDGVSTSRNDIHSSKENADGGTGSNTVIVIVVVVVVFISLISLTVVIFVLWRRRHRKLNDKRRTTAKEKDNNISTEKAKNTVNTGKGRGTLGHRVSRRRLRLTSSRNVPSSHTYEDLRRFQRTQQQHTDMESKDYLYPIPPMRTSVLPPDIENTFPPPPPFVLVSEQQPQPGPLQQQQMERTVV